MISLKQILAQCDLLHKEILYEFIILISEMIFQSEKFGMPSDRAINELGGGGKTSRAVALEVIKEWLEPEGYKITKEEEIETDLTESHRGYTDLVAQKNGETLRIEIEHRSPKEQVEKNIRKNLEYSHTLYIVTSDNVAKKKVIQVALKTMFRLREENPGDRTKDTVAIVKSSLRKFTVKPKAPHSTPNNCPFKVQLTYTSRSLRTSP